MVHYALSKRDKATMLAGARRAAEVMAAAGADAVLDLEPHARARFLFVEGGGDGAAAALPLFASDADEEALRESDSSHARLRAGAPGRDRAQHPAFRHWLDERQAAGIVPGRTPLFSAHQMGTARLGRDPESSVLDADGACWEVAGLYALDASTFPTATGVNPMVTTEAISYMLSARLAAKLRRREADGNAGD